MTGRLSRRRFLASTGAGLGLAAAAPLLLTGCGEAIPPIMVPLSSSDRVLVARRRQRIPIGLVSTGATVTPGADEALGFTVRRNDEVIDQITVEPHIVVPENASVEVDRSDDRHRYYPVWTTLPEPGIYDLEATIAGTVTSMPVQAFDRSEVVIPQVGEPFPPASTPTATNPDGVDHLCTRFEPCPLHQEDLALVMADGRPAVVLVASPALCLTAYCGFALDTVVAAVERLGTSSPVATPVAGIHVETWANPDEVGGDYNDPRIRRSAAVDAWGLNFDPCLFVIGADGTLVERLDVLFDQNELSQALDRLG